MLNYSTAHKIYQIAQEIVLPPCTFHSFPISKFRFLNFFTQISQLSFIQITYPLLRFRIYSKAHCSKCFFLCSFRSSYRRCSTKSILENFTKFNIHLCWSPFLIKLQASRPAALSKRVFSAGVFQGILRIF